MSITAPRLASRTRVLLTSLFILILVAVVLHQLYFARSAWAATSVFINEIHYDNTGTDAGEAIEIAGPAGTDLSTWSLVLYNGSGGATYDTDALSGVIPNQQNGFGTLSFSYPSNGIQNGSPDGIALVNGTTVVQFLSYEGTFAAVGGPANGMTSTDIGVSENGSEPLGQSLRLSGTGQSYEDFTWNAPATASFGAVNTGQTFNGADTAPAVSATIPADGATDVPINSSISVTFSESVNATPSAFTVECPTGASQTFSQSASPQTTYLLDPTSDLPASTTCTVSVSATQITDVDTNDPPDQMSADFSFSFSTAGPTPTPSPTPVPGSVVISQVYGGGGNAGATLKNDFIELINHSNSPINLNGWSVQVASATGTSWAVTSLTNFNLQPGQYYLIKQAAGAGGTVDLPTADATGTITMSATAAKVALVSNSTALSGACPVGGSIIDFVGYGGANCFEGAGAAPLLSNTTAALRNNDGCADSDNNSTDFSDDSPNPRNTSSPTTTCSVLLASGSASPNSVLPGENTTLKVAVSPAVTPPSTGISVTGDLSAIGGSPTQTFAGAGNMFTFVATVSMATTPGVKSFPVTVSDAEGRIVSTTIFLIVRGPHIVISQIYGGGGNTGAAYTHDFVELYNPTASTFDLTGWSVQYASATGSGWEDNRQPIGGSIGPGNYYLIALGSNGAVGASLPQSQISGEINMSASAGKVALVNSFQALTGPCPIFNSQVVDFVGYGGSGSGFCFEGSGGTAAPGNPTAVLRKNNGDTDTDNNFNDFIVGAPNPRQTEPIVELGPMAVSTDPSSNGFNVPKDGSIGITFTEPVSVDASWFNINCVSSSTHNSATTAVSNGGKTYVITPNVNFHFGEQCTVTILQGGVHDQDLDDSGPNTDTLRSDYVWSFTVVGAGDPAPYPPSVHLTFGNPSNAVTSLLEPNNYLMEKPGLALSYNRDKGTPNWVSWHLETDWIGSLVRFDTFRPDPAVPPDWYRVQATDYFGSGFDRGHMTPNADRDHQNRIPINQETFLMTNMVPQAPDNNQGPWANFENYLRSQLNLPDRELYIVAGPVGVGGEGSNGFHTTIAGGSVTVPSHTWKVVLVLVKGDDDVSRVTPAARTIAILMPNIQGIRTSNPDDWMTYLTTVDAVEQATGYDFFANVPDAIENAIEAGTNGSNPPGTENQSVTTAEDNSTAITLTAVSPQTMPTFTFTVVNGPTNGMLSGTGANLTYQPNPDFNGTDSFTFKANDGNQDSNVSTVNITITSVNDAPVANDDGVYSTDSNTTLNVPAATAVLSNDVDVDNVSLSVELVSGPSHGDLTLNPDGSFSYDPDLDYTGTDSFTYRAFDGVAYSNIATVNITVNDTVGPYLTSTIGMTLLSVTNSNLINVGLTATATDNGGGPVTIEVTVFGDEDDATPTIGTTVHSPDARDIAPLTLRLRGERVEANDGRVYLVIVTATDNVDNISRAYHTVVVPKNNKPANIAAVNAQAATAKAFAEANGVPPPSYFVIGDGPIVGPKQ